MQLFRVDRLLRNTQILGDIPDYRSLLIGSDDFRKSLFME